MPTGSGKSLCYQLPAVLLPGVTLVVSPLVALMKDQVEQLRRSGIAAAFVNSSQTEAERASTTQELSAGKLRLLYVAPERFRSATFRRALSMVELSLLVIDEAHCVSEWGHAFRPDYERLGDAAAELGAPRTLALTATATKEVRADIIRALRLRNPTVIVTGFDRPNIHLEVHELASEAERRDSIVAAVRPRRPAIVYTATRKEATTLARVLVMNDVRAAAYHAGLEIRQRNHAQEAFFRGDVDVIAATNAFGLGIDKADVRLVVHSTIPRSIDAYAQELGRAGRDGLAADAGVFFVPTDIFLLRRFLREATPAPELVEAILANLATQREPSPLSKIARTLPKSPSSRQVTAALGFLESLGAVHRQYAVEDGPGSAPAISLYGAVPGRRLSEEDLRRLRMRSFRDRQRLEHMVALLRGKRCRRAALLRELGEATFRTPCGGCDVCTGARLVPVRSRLPGRQSILDRAWAMSGASSTVSQTPQDARSD
jgi:ATP-dependent DNA helicase RecQ